MMIRLAAALATTLGADPSVGALPAASPVYDLERIVPCGEARTIAFYASLFPDCTPQGPVVIRVLSQPHHGKVTIETAQSFTSFVTSSPLAECNTRKVSGQKMVYQGAEGYEGVDSFRILVINPDGTGYESTVRIAVR
ncbi:hypothetical protein [Methylobacterium sp. NFXW15]|uniref:hypothetical protein n=1 Tax=Methylobacterium sp. NFXW15 TaxID=2819512 RepID=UPI003CFAECAB